MEKPIARRIAKTYALISLAVLAVALSWFRPIDNYTENYINESIKSAAIIFGISRTINAAVSVTQSAEIGIGVASVAPGEALDPINDLIEQFSEIMTISIASLVFQKVLLGISAHWFFNVLVTISAVAFITTLILRQHEIFAFKAFAILVIIRLFLSLVILANSAVDNIFLDSQVRDGERSIRILETEISEDSDESINQAEGTHTNATIDLHILKIEERIQQLNEQKSQLSGNITKLNAEIDAIKSDRPWWAPDFLSKDPQVREAKNHIKEIANEIDENESKLGNIEKSTSKLNDQRECFQKQTRGETCSWLEALSQYGSNLKQQAMNSTLAVEDKVDDLITLMALIVLRSIMLPLFFWILIFKTIKWIWANNIQLAKT